MDFPGIMLRLTLICLLAFVFLTGCKEKPEIPRAKLEELIASGLKKQARKEIAELLKIQNLKNSTPLSRLANPRRLIRGGLNGNTIAWVEDRFLFYWVNKNFEKLELDEFVPSGLALSHRGRFALLTRGAPNKGCRLHPVALREKEIIDIDLKADCGHTPAISDDGGVIYYVSGGKLHYRRLNPVQIGQLHSREFKSRFKKVSAFFHTKDMPDGSLFIFHGAAGYYKAFSMPSISAGVRYLGKGYAAPELYGRGRTPEFIARFATKVSGTQAADGEKKNQPGKKNAKKTAGATGLTYVYAGGAARRKLLTYKPGDKKLRNPRSLSYSPSLIYLEDLKKFLLIKQGQLHLMSEKGALEPLPMLAERFFVFKKGLAFEDASHRLYFRRLEFTPNEKLLLDLQKKANP